MSIDQIKEHFAATLAQFDGKPRRNRRYPRSFKRAVADAAMSGLSDRQIANAFELDPSTVKIWKRVFHSRKVSKKISGSDAFGKLKVIGQKKEAAALPLMTIEAPSGIKILLH